MSNAPTINRRAPSSTAVPAKDMLTELQGLESKLTVNEQITDKISQHFASLESKIEAMKQYRESMEHMNTQAGQRPKADLIKRSQTAIYENRKIRELVMENNDLKNALVEHQDALEYIMGKYRAQMGAFMDISRSKDEIPLKTDETELQSYVEKMSDLIAVSYEGIRRDEEHDLLNERELAKLKYENKYLRECLGIGKAFGSIEHTASIEQSATDTGES